MCIVLGFLLPLMLTWCSWNKTTTEINSDATLTQPAEPKWTISELTAENLMPSKIVGTKSISLAGINISVSDDGMHDIFVMDTRVLADEVFAWLTVPGDPVNKTKVSLKQATISVGGSKVIIPDGAELAPHLSGYNLIITTSGNDLIIIANKVTAPYESYLLIDGTLQENYLLTNPQDWFGNALYMIPQKTPSLLKFARWSDVQSVSIFYVSGDSLRWRDSCPWKNKTSRHKLTSFSWSEILSCGIWWNIKKYSAMSSACFLSSCKKSSHCLRRKKMIWY